jgi:hypothetical protein
MNKIIYISFIRLTDKVARDWYVEFCIEKGAKVEFWDVVSLVRVEHVEYGALEPDYLQVIKSYKQFETLLRLPENAGAVFVMIVSYSGRFSKPFRLLSKFNCKMVHLSWGTMPSTSAAPRWQRIIYLLLMEPIRSFDRIFDTILGIGYRKLNIVKQYEIVFVAGKVLSSVEQYGKRVVSFNYSDYDHYKQLAITTKRLIQGKYAVFLDANAPYHSDAEIMGLKLINADNYYQSLNRFFGLLEKNYDLKVVIALNPKSNYGKEKYENRESHRLHTAELVKDAEFVILHQSSALSYAVLNLKPVLFIYTKEMMEIYKTTVIREIEGLASYLNAHTYNIDKISDGRQIILQPIIQECYDTYKYNYLTSLESESMSSAEIFWREINAV